MAGQPESSTASSDDAVQRALAEARKTLRSIKAVDVVSLGLRGDNLEEWRAHVRIAFLVESVSDRPDTASVRIGQAATTR
jgi:flavin-binding protein dodecin